VLITNISGSTEIQRVYRVP